MSEVRSGSGDERDGRRPLVAREASHRADADGDPGEDHHEEEAESDDAAVRELLERDAVRL
jgi:hypothetical protein